MIIGMRRMRRALIAVVFAAVLAVPGQALALHLAPPGKAGADQYFETVPTSAGNAAPPSGGATNGHALAQLGHGRVGAARLSHLGKTGQAAAALAAATAPTPASRLAANGRGATGRGANVSGANGSGAGASTTISQPQAKSAVSAIVDALAGSDDGGLGLALPLLLVTALIVALGLGLVALRRRDRPGGAAA